MKTLAQIQIFLLYFYNIVFLANFSYSQLQEKKISDIDVLLPLCYSDNCDKVVHTVSAFGGCYEWIVDKQHLLNLEQVLDLKSDTPNDACYNSVILSPKIINFTNENAWLTARDKKSNEQFKCKVSFGLIYKLQIKKQFFIMNKGEISELNVNAYDDKENLFSTVEGFRFLWKVSNNKILELVNFSNERRDNTVKRAEIEKSAHSDYILTKGLSTGKVNVSVELLDEEFKGVTPHSKIIYVVEQFTIFPESPLYILPNNTFEYNIKLIVNENQREDIKYEQRSSYTWGLRKDCGNIKGFGKFTSHDNVCETDIEVHDIRIDAHNSDSKKLYVVYPTTLEIGLMELTNDAASELVQKIELLKNFEFVQAKNLESYFHINDYTFSRNWNLVVERYYIIKNVLFYNTFPVFSNKNYIDYKIDFNKLFNEHVELIKCSEKNEVCLIKAKQITKEIKLEIETNTVINKENKFGMKKFISIVNKVEIMKFGKSEFILPYLGYKNNNLANDNPKDSNLLSQELRLIVTGGTGKYIFYSDNSNVIDIKKEVLYGQNIGRTVNYLIIIYRL